MARKDCRGLTEVRTNGGATPLHYAIQSGNIYVIGTCLNMGMHPFAEDYLGQSAIVYAKQAASSNGQNILHLIEQAQK